MVDKHETSKLSRRALVAGVAAALPSLNVSVAFAAEADTEIANLARRVAGLWEDYNRAIQALEERLASCPDPLPSSEICASRLPHELIACLDHIAKSRALGCIFQRNTGGETIRWVTPYGWQIAAANEALFELIPPAYRGREDAWIARRHEMAVAFEAELKASRDDAAHAQLEDAIEKAFDEGWALEEKIISLPPTSLADLKIQANVAARRNVKGDESFEIGPSRAAALVSAIMSLGAV